MNDESDHEELRIPTRTVYATVTCADGSRWEGRLFLPADAASHEGATRPDERLNDATAFFPFLPQSDERPIVLGKTQVLTVTVAVEEVAPEGDEDDILDGRSVPPSAVERRVAVELAETRLTGVLAVDMPEYQSRVLDYLNLPEPFLSLRVGDRVVYVNRSHVVRVREI